MGEFMGLVLLFFINECFDIWLNSSKSLSGLIFGYYARYRRSRVLFLITHLNFILLSFAIFGLNLSGFLLFLLYTLYGLDLAFKLYICDKLQKGENFRNFSEIEAEIPILARFGIAIFMSYLFFLSIH